MFVVGGAQTIKSLTNLNTGETCAVSVTCGRIGPGVIVEGGMAVSGSIFGPQCGNGLNGFSFQVSAGAVSPAGGGTVDLNFGGGIGGGSSVGGGAGLYAAVGACAMTVSVIDSQKNTITRKSYVLSFSLMLSGFALSMLSMFVFQNQVFLLVGLVLSFAGFFHYISVFKERINKEKNI